MLRGRRSTHRRNQSASSAVAVACPAPERQISAMTTQHPAALTHTEALRLVDISAYMAWVDRRLDANEISAARGVAVVHGVDRAGAGLLAKGPIDPLSFEIAALESGSRDIAYATALWIALADGVLGPPERYALDRLAWCLGLERDRRETLEDIVWAWAGAVGEWEQRYAGVLQQVRTL